MTDLIAELTWRGMVHDQTPGTAQQLRQPTAAYIGFDPTAASLHVGNLATLMLLVHLQRAGHTPIALVGGATGMIGDPSGKASERAFLSEEKLRSNQAGIQTQLQKFLDFSGNNAAEVVNNFDWLGKMGFLEFLRDVGKHLTVNYMMAKDSVKNRIEGGSGISFTEFSYQLLQGYDFYWLYKNKNVRLQMGGSDQWGNITAGTELIRRLAGGEAFALTAPLLTKADGSKFGKSEGGNLWLDANLTSPYKFYQFWLNASDEEAPKLIRVFTLLSQKEIESLEIAHNLDKAQRILQKALAEQVTKLVHSAEIYRQVLAASEMLFGKNDSLPQENEPLWDVLPQVQFSQAEFASLPNVLELLFAAAEKQKNADEKPIFESKSDIRKLVQGNGVSVNRVKISDVNQSLQNLIAPYLLIQKGRKEFCLVRVMSYEL
jgi:tyrosyl-tRNA synthetase